MPFPLSFESFTLQASLACLYPAHCVLCMCLQLWVGALGSGPGGRELQASYRLTEMSDFRQELGSTILQVCKVIPYGVLCFLPSYGLLEALRQQ
jgi:Fanconi anemia group J protein